MENCNNRRTGIISSITAYRVGDIQFAHPFNILRPYLGAEDYVMPSEPQPIRINLVPDSAELSDTSGTAAHGRPVDVVLKFTLRQNSQADMDSLMKLHSEAYDIVVEYFGGAVCMVRSDKDGYLFNWDTGKTSVDCQFSIQNVSGVQTIIK